jgi:hypothetical protein
LFPDVISFGNKLYGSNQVKNEVNLIGVFMRTGNVDSVKDEMKTHRVISNPSMTSIAPTD